MILPFAPCIDLTQQHLRAHIKIHAFVVHDQGVFTVTSQTFIAGEGDGMTLVPKNLW